MSRTNSHAPGTNDISKRNSDHELMKLLCYDYEQPIPSKNVLNVSLSTSLSIFGSERSTNFT